MRRVWSVVFLLLLSAFAGCWPAPVEDRGSHTSGWLDLSADGKRYYGLYLTAESDGRVVAASGVLLMPWDDRPDCSVTIQDGDTLIDIQGQQERLPGRPLLLLASSDTEVRVVAKDIDLSQYGSRQRLTEAVKGLLSGTSW